MTFGRNLPPEILIIIFNYTSTRSLIHCQQVCKEWKHPARVVFYKHIEFLNGTQLGCFNQSNKLDATLGKLVRSIGFSPLLVNQVFDIMNKSMFTNVAKSCPHVERILVDRPNKDFWNICYFLCLKYWSRISYLPKTKEHYPIYLRTAMACCQTLERLEVVPKYFESRGGHWTELANVIFKPFQKVHTLRFILFSYKDAIYTFDPLLNQFKNITKINLTYEGVYRRIQGDDHIVMDFTDIVPIRTLDRLIITKGRINANSINYLSRKFTNLQTIKMNLGYYHTNYTDSEIVPIFDYAMKITKSTINIVAIKDLDILHLFVDRIGSSPVALTVSYYGTCNVFGTFQSRIRLSHNKLYTDATTNTNIVIPNEPSRITIETDRNPFTDADVYQKNVQDIVGNRLSFLSIDLLGDMRFEEESNFSLDDVFQYCNLLKTLVYAARHLEQSTQINSSICNLTFIGIKLSNSVFPQLSKNLPCLQRFQLIDCEILEENSIDMSFTSFRSFHLSDSSKEIRSISVDVSTDTNEYCFECKRNKDYSITSVKQMNLYLKCKSIQYIDITCDGLKIKNFI